MKTIHLQLPDPVVAFIHSLSNQKETFVREAIEEKIANEKKYNLSLLLKEGYQATFEEDLAISKEFEHADFEGL